MKYIKAAGAPAPAPRVVGFRQPANTTGRESSLMPPAATTVADPAKQSIKDALGIKSACITACSEATTPKDLVVPPELWAIWADLMNRLPTDEWLMIYNVNDAGVITEWDFPKQKVTKTMVEIVDGDGSGFNGVVHSHNDMGSFHSGQDDLQCRNLYNYSIVLSKKGSEINYVATAKAMTPCGKFLYKNIKVNIEYAQVKDVVTDYIERIVKPTYNYPPYTPPSQGSLLAGYHGQRDWDGYDNDVFTGSRVTRGNFRDNANPHVTVVENFDDEYPMDGTVAESAPPETDIHFCANCNVGCVNDCFDCKHNNKLADWVKSIFDSKGYKAYNLEGSLPMCGEGKECLGGHYCGTCVNVIDAVDLFTSVYKDINIESPNEHTGV